MYVVGHCHCHAKKTNVSVVALFCEGSAIFFAPSAEDASPR